MIGKIVFVFLSFSSFALTKDYPLPDHQIKVIPPSLRELGVISPEHVPSPYSIHAHMEKINTIKGKKGLIIGRGNIQNITVVQDPYNKLETQDFKKTIFEDSHDITWTFLDPDYKAHNLTTDDPILMINLNMRNPSIKDIIFKLKDTFDLVVFDVETIKYFQNPDFVLSMGVWMTKLTGKIIIPLDPSTIKSLETLLETLDNIEDITPPLPWPFLGNHPGNYGLDMTKVAQRILRPIAILSKKDDHAPKIHENISTFFKLLNDGDTLLIKFLFHVSMGYLEKEHELLPDTLHFLTTLWKKMDTSKEITQYQIDLISTFPESIQSFAYWIIAEHYHKHKAEQEAIEFYLLSEQMGCVLSSYRAKGLTHDTIRIGKKEIVCDEKVIDHYLDILHTPIMQRSLSNVLFYEFQESIYPIKDQLKLMIGQIPALIYPTLWMIDKRLDDSALSLNGLEKQTINARRQLLLYHSLPKP